MRPAKQSSPTLPTLFSPFEVGPFRLPNRIVMAPMTRSRASVDRVPSPLAATYYAQRASAGLIITEAAQVSPEGAGYPNTPGIFRLDQAAAWRGVAGAVHASGGTILLQLWHAGRVSHPVTLPDGVLPVAPSPIAPAGTIHTSLGKRTFATPRELGRPEIVTIVDQFAQAALIAREIGFDGVDIHASNGYLIDQFLRNGANRRSDSYGGTPANRCRFLIEITEAVCQVWGGERVGVRLSPLQAGNDMHDSDPALTFGCAAAALDRLGLAYLHVVEPGPGHPMATAQGLGLIRLLRQLFRGNLMVDGGRDRASGEAALVAAEADLVAFATPFIANPDLVERLAQELPLAAPEPATFYAGGASGYTDYPRLSDRPALSAEITRTQA